MDTQVEKALHDIDSCIRAGRLHRALKKCKKAAKENPANEALLCAQAEVSLCMGRMEESKALIDQFVALCPASGRALYLKGALLLMEDRFEEAKSFLIQALELAPELYQARKFLADALIETGALERAGKIIEEELKIHASKSSMESHLAGILSSRANLLSKQGLDKEARDETCRALRRYPGNPLLLHQLRCLNPAVDNTSRHYSLELSGSAPITSLYPNNPSDFLGSYEVIANSKREALEYIKEVEPIALPDSLQIISCKARKAPHFSRRGVLVMKPSFSMEIPRAGSTKMPLEN